MRIAICSCSRLAQPPLPARSPQRGWPHRWRSGGSAVPRRMSSERHMKRPAEGGGEVKGWSSCGGWPPPRVQGRGGLAGETSVGSGNAWA